jgi:hypothetical protein
VWIDLFLFKKPTQQIDAINVVDTVCDAIKIGIGVDDVWFSIRRLDWSVVRDNPIMWIGIGQDTNIEHRICSTCKRYLEIGEFPINSGRRGGVNQYCNDCRVAGKLRK